MCSAFAFKDLTDGVLSDQMTDGLVLPGVKISFTLKNWVNTMSNPSQNYYTIVTGYTKDDKDYYVDAFRVLIEMFEPESALLVFDTGVTQTGETIDLTISYDLTQTMLSNCIF